MPAWYTKGAVSIEVVVHWVYTMTALTPPQSRGTMKKRLVRIAVFLCLLALIIAAITYHLERGTITVTPQAERERMERLEQAKQRHTLAPFVSDGCSGMVSEAWTLAVQQIGAFSKDMNERYADATSIPFQFACEAHDRLYHAGEGGYVARFIADNKLRTDIHEYALTHREEIRTRAGLSSDEAALYLYDIIADLVYHGVRVGGAPCSGKPYAWGFGYGAGSCE
jgi:heme exporter protein D